MKILYVSFTTTIPKKYRVLRRLDIAALHIFQVGNLDKAVEYLVANTDRDSLSAQKYIHKLLKEYQQYRLEERAL